MARYNLGWRQAAPEGSGVTFVGRLAYADGVRAAKRLADELGDRAWHREFRVQRQGREVFTDLHQIQDWDPCASDLPQAARHHIWRDDLERALVVDLFLDAIGCGISPAVAAGVLKRHDGDALLRFARASVLRPRL